MSWSDSGLMEWSTKIMVGELVRWIDRFNDKYIYTVERNSVRENNKEQK